MTADAHRTGGPAHRGDPLSGHAGKRLDEGHKDHQRRQRPSMFAAHSRLEPMVSDDVRIRARTLRSQGHSIRAIGGMIGVPYRTVGNWLRGVTVYHDPRSCQLCGTAFLPNEPRQRFCTPAHQRKHYYVFGGAA